VVAIGQENVS